MLLRKRREPLQDRLGDERGHLPYMSKVVGILDSMDDEIRALRKNGLREFTGPLRSGENEQPVLSPFLGNPLVNSAGVYGIAGWLLRDVSMRFLKKQMDRKPIAWICLSEQPKGHSSEH